MGNIKTSLELLALRLESLREDIPRNLTERNGENITDLETFNMRIIAMRSKLNDVISELTHQSEDINYRNKQYGERRH